MIGLNLQELRNIWNISCASDQLEIESRYITKFRAESDAKVKI